MVNAAKPKEEVSGRVMAKAHQLHWDGYTKLETGMPEWDIRRRIEALHVKYHARILEELEGLREDWMKGDEEGTAPGCGRPGGLAAEIVNKGLLKDTGAFLYAAHPSQEDEADDDVYSGPRWYLTCTEALRRRYEDRGVCPPPPTELQELLWPAKRDKCQPWLTEAGWTIVPQDSDPQVMHCDLCSYEEVQRRKNGRGRYQHFVWKMDPSAVCTTNIVPGRFTEGSATWDDYDNWTSAKARALIFDSEMLHRGAATSSKAGWSTTLTLQVCSGSGWDTLNEIVSERMMWYTMPFGWQEGDAVDALVKGSWRHAVVLSRSESGDYRVALEPDDEVAVGLKDANLRYRQRSEQGACENGFRHPVGAPVEAMFNGEWHGAKVARQNADGTYRLVWKSPRSFTDAVPASSLRCVANLSEAESTSADSHTASTSAESQAASVETKTKMKAKKKKRKATPDAIEPAARKKRKATPVDDGSIASRLLNVGMCSLDDGLPKAWQWAVFEFVEACYDCFHQVVLDELQSLRAVWEPHEDSGQRHGAFAAAKATERLSEHGVAVYSPGCSQSEAPPYDMSGPRWYVSVTGRALRRWPAKAPAPPAGLFETLCSNPADSGGDLRARGLGWTLAPPGSDPQALHADIWGSGKHARSSGTCWPHILWKRQAGEKCTTEIVPGAFTEGASSSAHFDAVMRASAPAIVVDSEVLHRGAATPSERWGSSLSIEFCTEAGWAAWEAEATGGTTKDPTSELDWRMLNFGRPGEQASDPESRDPYAPASPPSLPPAPWADAAGLKRLRQEQREWEFS